MSSKKGGVKGEEKGGRREGEGGAEGERGEEEEEEEEEFLRRQQPSQPGVAAHAYSPFTCREGFVEAGPEFKTKKMVTQAKKSTVSKGLNTGQWHSRRRKTA